MVAITAASLTDLLARSGGGGSDSGGGGEGIIMLLGYLPMHFIGSRLRRSSPDRHTTLPKQIIGWTIGIIYSAFWILILRHFLGFLIAAAAIAGTGAGLYNWFGKITQSKAVQSRLSTAAQSDSVWNEASLLARATEVFGRYQHDWSTWNSEAMKSYMTPEYQYHAALLLYALQLGSRQNIVENPEIHDIVVVNMADSTDNNQDLMTIGITASANDKLIDTRSQTVLFADKNEFTEYWQFRRQGNQWLLDGIQQATEAAWTRNRPIEQFARANGYRYSADMGWLLIPAKGQLFGSAKFGKSDINNHVIGLYKQQLLIQLYTYRPDPQNTTSYVIAQVSVPKNYGSIVVRRKKGLSLFGIRGLEKVSTEWTQFNDKFEVYATSAEQATSFELLNPRYMEQLEAAPFEVNIEVVDNVIYFYSTEATTEAAHYQAMLQLLQLAFLEMRL